MYLHYIMSTLWVNKDNKQASLAGIQQKQSQNFLGGGACPQTPLEGKALRALLTGALGAGIVTVQIPPNARVKVEM